MSEQPDDLLDLAAQLERAAAQLRELQAEAGGGADADPAAVAATAAQLVEACGRIATEAGAELDRRARQAENLA